MNGPDLARYVCGAPAVLGEHHHCHVCGFVGAQLAAAFRFGVALGLWDREGYKPGERAEQERERERIERGRLW